METYRKYCIALFSFTLTNFLNKSMYLTLPSVNCLRYQNVSFLLILISFLLGLHYHNWDTKKTCGLLYTVHTLLGIAAIFLYVFYSLTNLEHWGDKSMYLWIYLYFEKTLFVWVTSKSNHNTRLCVSKGAASSILEL